MRIPELTINWHVREECNFDCYFCYAKYGQNSSFARSYPKILQELAALKGANVELTPHHIVPESVRLNFAGGEPFLEKQLGPAISLAHSLGLRPSFISNGILLKDDFIHAFGKKISVAGFSIDSFDNVTNARIGRQDSKGRQLSYDRLSHVLALFREVSPETTLKINTVVCQENEAEDMTEYLQALSPDRWKILRVIPIHGAENRAVSDDQYMAFLERHSGVQGRVIPEDNKDMHRSYLMLDPEGSFYQREGSSYQKTPPIAQVGAVGALKGVEFDAETYLSRY